MSRPARPSPVLRTAYPGESSGSGGFEGEGGSTRMLLGDGDGGDSESPPQWLPEWLSFGSQGPGGRGQPQYESEYVALVPLHDSRLKPRNTLLLVSLMGLFALGAALSVYLLVPREVSVSWHGVERQTMSWNETEASYSLALLAKLHVKNPNFVTATVGGELEVWYYSTLAGRTKLKHTRVGARDSVDLRVQIDASNVSNDYVLTILRQCTFFPHQLVVFLRSRVQASYLLKSKEMLPNIDTYAVFNCSTEEVFR